MSNEFNNITQIIMSELGLRKTIKIEQCLYIEFTKHIEKLYFVHC